MADVIETATVAFTVTGIELVRDRGTFRALAIVELDINGVIVTLSGVQVHRNRDGRTEVKAPLWRHPRTGRWLPGVLLPPELAEALAAEVAARLDAQPHGFAT